MLRLDMKVATEKDMIYKRRGILLTWKEPTGAIESI